MAANSRPVKAVFFDLGYTLIYFSGDFRKETFASYLILADQLIQVGCELDRQGFAVEFEKRIHQYFTQRNQDYLERPVIDILRSILTDLGQNRYPNEVYLKCMEAMYRFTERLWLVEEDTHELLHWLVEHDYRLGLISNASSAWDVNNLIDNHHLRPYFSTILISASEGIRKPDPAIFHRAAEHLQIDLANAIMVGDTLDADILGAHCAGIRGIWVSRHKETERALMAHFDNMHPDAEIRSLRELPAILNDWNQQ
jgi:putative hydrolase of the HAD superfamily